MLKKLSPMQQSNKGFFTFAQNNTSTDYVRLAYGLALSLKKSQSVISNLSIGVSQGYQVPEKYAWAFDKIIEIPWQDDAENESWKLSNEWKAIYMSPYDETIKLDCDMLFLSDITSWWQYFEAQPLDLLFTNTVRNWIGCPVTSDYYRKVFTDNNLPNIYTGFFYFRKKEQAYQTFDLAKMIFWNWERFFEEFLQANSRPTFLSTDVIFALAMKILDFEKTSYQPTMYPTFTHMKTMIQGWNYENLSEDWREHVKPFFTDNCECIIGNHRQVYPFHYHIKDFLTDDIISIYEKAVKYG
jgi:hypothetical protein